MNSGRHERRKRGGNEFAALTRHFEGFSEQCLGRRRSETHQDTRLDERDLGFEPRTARADLGSVRLRVNTTLTSRLPLEMLDDVGHVYERAVDIRLRQCFVQQ